MPTLEYATGRRAYRAHDQLSARVITEQERAALALDEPAAVLVVLHVVTDTAGAPLEATEAVYPPEYVAYEPDYLV